MRIRNIVVMLLLIVWAFPVLARGGGHRSSGSSSSSGTTHVSGYTRKDGTYVAPHYRSAPGTASTYSTPAYTPAPSSSFTPVPAPTPSYTPTTTPTYRTPSSSSRSVHTYSRSGAHTTHRTRITHTTSMYSVRDSHGRFKRSSSAKHQFMKQTGYSRGRPGYVIDHIKPLCRGSLDAPSNMQWQTAAAAKVKDRTECH